MRTIEKGSLHSEPFPHKLKKTKLINHKPSWLAKRHSRANHKKLILEIKVLVLCDQK
jgi:hypothetical protein